MSNRNEEYEALIVNLLIRVSNLEKLLIDNKIVDAQTINDENTALTEKFFEAVKNAVDKSKNGN